MSINRIYNKGFVAGIILLLVLVSFGSSAGMINTEKSPNTLFNGSLLGYVNDTSGNPIEGALVMVFFHDTFRLDFSDENGFYHVKRIPICFCMKDVVCSKRGYKSEKVSLGIVENTVYDFILTKKTTDFVMFRILYYKNIYLKNIENPFFEQFSLLNLLLHRLRI
jgi:hypothetical protein